jgi:endonuclease I
VIRPSQFTILHFEYFQVFYAKISVSITPKINNCSTLAGYFKFLMMYRLNFHKSLRLRFFNILLVLSLVIVAQPPANYYNNAFGKTEAQLKTTLKSIISSGYVSKSYDYLYTIYASSDVTSDGKVWDMYSTCTWTPGQKKCGNYSTVCDCYNREHSIPQSWFNSNSPMVSDAFHVYPTDGKVNGQRSSYPFGECTGGTTLSKGKGRLGSSTFAGYSGTVFEPDDEFKGDFARTYFYFATRYENIMKSIGGESFNNTVYPAFTTWSTNLFLKWHRQDPVSQKEITRNNAIYVHQKNRNPYIDYPELAEFVWGNRKGTAWNITSVEDKPATTHFFSYNAEGKTVNVNIDSTKMRYSIINISGQKVKSGSVEPFAPISVSSLYPGIYFIKYESNQIKAIRKFIIQ